MSLRGGARPWRKRAIKLSIAALLVFVVVPYGWNVASRLSATECKRETYGIYVGEMCYRLKYNGMVFRLYDAQSGDLLAERTYVSPYPTLAWGKNYVVYDTGASDGMGQVDLPPTWWDRFLARLP